MCPLVYDGAYTSPAIQKIKSKLDLLQKDLAIYLNRPSLSSEDLSHELYFSVSRPGSKLRRHMDERHPELSKRGYSTNSRRSLSFLVYLSESDWDMAINGGELRVFSQLGKKSTDTSTGGSFEGCLQVGWLSTPITWGSVNDRDNAITQPLYMDSWIRGVDDLPKCKLFVLRETSAREGTQLKSANLRHYVSNTFEVRDPLTGKFQKDFNSLLFDSVQEAGSMVHLLEDSELWDRGFAPPNTERVEVNPCGGRLVIFDSVILPHEVAEVKRGNRRALAGWFHESAYNVATWVL